MEGCCRAESSSYNYVILPPSNIKIYGIYASKNSMGTLWHSNASVAGICPAMALNSVYAGSRGSIWANLFSFFYFLGKAGDIYNSIRMPNYWYGLYADLGMYTMKFPSSWTQVWFSAWPPTAPIMGPGGRDLDDF